MRKLSVAPLLLYVLAAACSGNPRPVVPESTATFNGHPLTLHFANASAPPARPLLVFATGDGGMHRKDLDFYRHLDAWGYPLVGFDARDYVKHLGTNDTTTPERLADDYRAMIARAREALHLDPGRHVVLIGVSRGAGLSVVAAAELRDVVSGVVAVALTREEEYVRWVHHVVPRREVMVDIEEYLPELGDIPLAVVQSAHDKYMPGPTARALLGPDTPHRWLQIVDARNHTFSDARPEMYADVEHALEWVQQR